MPTDNANAPCCAFRAAYPTSTAPCYCESTKQFEGLATVYEVWEGQVRLYIGAPGHQHRILFDLPDGQSAEPFRRARSEGRPVRVWIEVPGEQA